MHYARDRIRGGVVQRPASIETSSKGATTKLVREHVRSQPRSFVARGRPVAHVLNSRGVLFSPFLFEYPTDRMTPIQFNPIVANWSDPPVSPIRQVEFAGHP